MDRSLSSFDSYLSFIGLVGSEEDIHERRLACSVGSGQNNRTVVYGQPHPGIVPELGHRQHANGKSALRLRRAIPRRVGVMDCRAQTRIGIRT